MADLSDSLPAGTFLKEYRIERILGSGTFGITYAATDASGGMVAIKDKEVGPGDMERVIEAARALAIPTDQKVLHILPQEYIIDKQEGIREPIGMCGVRLEAKVHIVTGAVSAAQNIIKCVRRCGLEVDDVILGSAAPRRPNRGRS